MKIWEAKDLTKLSLKELIRSLMTHEIIMEMQKLEEKPKKNLAFKIIGVIIFGSVRFLSKKITKMKFFFEKKPKLVQIDRFRFDFLGQNRFKPVWLGFFDLGSVQFVFFKILIGLVGFFSRFGFFSFFSGFLGFLGLIGFFIFLLTPTKLYIM